MSKIESYNSPSYPHVYEGSPYQLDCRYLSHLFGDSFLKSSVHEGWHIADAILHLLHFLENERKDERLNSLCESLKETLEWTSYLYAQLIYAPRQDREANIHKVTDKIIQTLEKLQIEDSFLILGGYEGHTCLYEFVKESESTFSFSVINTGDGNRFHHVIINGENRGKIEPAYTLYHVPKEKLLNAKVIESLIRLKLEPSDFFVTALYEEFLPSLGGQRKPMSLDSQDYMQSQRAGTCSFKVLWAYLRRYLPYEQYKRLKLKARLDVFEFCHETQKKIPLNQVMRDLVSEYFANSSKNKTLEQLPSKHFSLDELLSLGLIKAQKTLKKHWKLLSSDELNRTNQWYQYYFHQSLYDELAIKNLDQKDA